MVQVAPRRKRAKEDDLNSRYRQIVSEVRALPSDMLADLLHEIADAMREQAMNANGSNGAPAITATETDDANEAAQEQPGGYDLVIAAGGPMAEVARMLKRGNLTDEERQRMKDLAYEAVVSRPPLTEPPPTIEEAKEMLHRHRMEKYGR